LPILNSSASRLGDNNRVTGQELRILVVQPRMVHSWGGDSTPLQSLGRRKRPDPQVEVSFEVTKEADRRASNQRWSLFFPELINIQNSGVRYRCVISMIGISAKPMSDGKTQKFRIRSSVYTAGTSTRKYLHWPTIRSNRSPIDPDRIT